MTLPAFFSHLRARWKTLGTKDQTLLRSAALVVGLALIWWVLIAPPLRILRQADLLQRSLDAQAQKMQSLQAQAQALQSQPKLSRDDALRALDTSIKQRLGTSAQLTVQGDRVALTLKNAPADALAQWLVQARVNARAVPSEAHLVRSATSATPATPGSRTVVAWDGTLVLSLPAQ